MRREIIIHIGSRERQANQDPARRPGPIKRLLMSAIVCAIVLAILVAMLAIGLSLVVVIWVAIAIAMLAAIVRSCFPRSYRLPPP